MVNEELMYQSIIRARRQARTSLIQEEQQEIKLIRFEAIDEDLYQRYELDFESDKPEYCQI
jgi:hypothetical protein